MGFGITHPAAYEKGYSETKNNEEKVKLFVASETKPSRKAVITSFKF